MKKPFAFHPNSTKNTTRSSNLHDNLPAMKSLYSSNCIVNLAFWLPVKSCVLAVAIVAVTTPLVRATQIVVETNTFSIAPNSTLDIQNNVLIIHNATPAAGASMLAQVTSELTLGINLAAAGWWNGNGDATGGSIRSTNAAATFATFTKGVGVLKNEFAGNPIYASFFGVAVGINDVLVRYTWEGDADLSGNVDATDQFLLDNGVANSLTGWLNADFDYSNAVDATDQFLLDNAVAAGADINPPLVGASKAGVVPEPGSLALLAVGALGALGRRRARA